MFLRDNLKLNREFIYNFFKKMSHASRKFKKSQENKD